VGDVIDFDGVGRGVQSGEEPTLLEGAARARESGVTDEFLSRREPSRSEFESVDAFHAALAEFWTGRALEHPAFSAFVELEDMREERMRVVREEFLKRHAKR
jgi:hypothetical protein